MGIFGASGAETRGSSCGVPETGDEVKGKNAEGRFVTEVGGEKITSGSGDTTAPDLFGKETGDSGGMGGSTDHIQCMYEGYGLRGRGNLWLTWCRQATAENR